MNFLKKFVGLVSRVGWKEKQDDAPVMPSPTPQEQIAEMMEDSKYGTHSDEVIDEAIRRELGQSSLAVTQENMEDGGVLGLPKDSRSKDGKSPGSVDSVDFAAWIEVSGFKPPLDLHRYVSWGGDCYLDFTVNKGSDAEARILKQVMPGDKSLVSAKMVGLPHVVLDADRPLGRGGTQALLDALQKLGGVELIEQEEKIFRYEDIKNTKDA